MRKRDFIEGYLSEEINSGKASNLHIDDEGSLVNYYTKICHRTPYQILLNGQKYSSTTSVNQNIIRRFCEHYNVDLVEYDNEGEFLRAIKIKEKEMCS